MTSLPTAVQGGTLTTPDRVVWKIEAVPCSAAGEFLLVFEAVSARWRQGVWLATDGLLRVGDSESPQIVLWQDTAPATVHLQVVSTDGLLRLYNVWDSGRGRTVESQSATSGMLREKIPTGWRYRCSDIAPHPTFDALVFRLDRV